MFEHGRSVGYIPGSELFLVWSKGIPSFENSANSVNGLIDNQILHIKPEKYFFNKIYV